MQILLPASNFCSPFGVFLGSMYRWADQLWWRHIRAHFPHFTIVWSNTLLCSNCLFGTGQRWRMASVSLWRKHQTKAVFWGTKTKGCVTVSANTTRCGGLEYKDKYRIVFVDFAQCPEYECDRLVVRPRLATASLVPWDSSRRYHPGRKVRLQDCKCRQRYKSKIEKEETIRWGWDRRDIWDKRNT